MKTKYIIIFLCIALLSIQPSQEVMVEGTPTSPFSPNSINQSGEFDTIDSFSVHPLNRWDITNAGFTAEVSNNHLNMSDVGDGSADAYTIERELRTLDGKIEVRFKFDTNDSTIHSSNRMFIELIDVDDIFGAMTLTCNRLIDNDFAVTILEWYDKNHDVVRKTFAGNERLFDNIWYTIVMDYNTPESEFRFRMYFDNGTKLWDINFFELSTIVRPLIWNAEVLEVFIRTDCLSTNKYVECLYDYVKAPFKERDWTQTDVPVDSDYLQDSWNFAEVQDDIDENSNYTLTIPALDSVAGSFSSEVDIPANYELTPPEDVTTSYFRLYAVDYDDGELHEIIEVLSSRYGSFAAGIFAHVRVYVDDSATASYAKTDFASTTDPKVEFTMELVNDRTVLNLRGRHWEDKLVVDVFYDFLVTVDLSDITADFSQEFVIETSQYVAFVGDFNYKSSYDYLTIVERGEFSGKGMPIVPPVAGSGNTGGLFGWLVDIFITIIRALGVFIMPGLIIINESVRAIQGWLDTVGAAITTAIGEIANDIWVAMGDALDFITDAIALIEGWLNTAIGFIQSWVEAIITDFIAGAQDLMEAIILGLIQLFADVWDFVVGIFFFVWDLLTLPDLLAIAAVGLEGIVEILLGAPAFILSVINDWILPLFIVILCIYWFVVIFLSFGEEGFEPIAGLSKVVDRLLIVYNFSIFGIGPLPIPIALFFIPMTYFLIVVPSGSIFSIW